MLVGISVVFWTLWKCRKNLIFENKTYAYPLIVIKLICYWIVGWSILQIKEERKEALMVEARVLKHVANEVYKASHRWHNGVYRLGV